MRSPRPFRGRLNDGAGSRGGAGRPRRAAPARSAERADLLLDAPVALADDDGTAPPRRAAGGRWTPSGDGVPARSGLRWLWLGRVVALEIWDDDAWDELVGAPASSSPARRAL